MNNLHHHAIPSSASLICSQQATLQVPAQAVSCFKLSAGRALSLTPRAPGELRIAHGQVWVTFGNAAQDITARAGDHFLTAGEWLRLAPGQQLVMEAHEKESPEPVYFSWEPDAAVSRPVSSRSVLPARIDVRQPLRDLGLALHLAGNALGRLAQCLAAGLAGVFVPHRSPATCTAQCLTIRN
jgi:Protein of unknown function (DUF2917)